MQILAAHDPAAAELLDAAGQPWPRDSTDRIDSRRDTSMGTVHDSPSTSAVRPTEVFALVAEPRNMPRWYDAVDDVAQDDGRASGTGLCVIDVTRSLPAVKTTTTSKSPITKSIVSSPSRAAWADAVPVSLRFDRAG